MARSRYPDPDIAKIHNLREKTDAVIDMLWAQIEIDKFAIAGDRKPNTWTVSLRQARL